MSNKHKVNEPDFTATALRILLAGPYKYLREKFEIYAQVLKVLGCLIFPLLIILLPPEWLLFDNLTITQHRTVFIFALAAIFWIVEPIPIFATSVLIIFLELLLLSDSGLNLPIAEYGHETLGVVIGYKEILSSFANPIIFLFLGGFFLAISATKFKLDQVMANTFIRPFGTRPSMVMLGLMIITAVFSMFMSNTATTAMMLSILMPVLASMDENDRGRIAFVLCIPVAANLGGIGTPIGTPPNAIAMKYLTDEAITFSQWMLMGVPFVIVMVIIGWLLLMQLFPTSTKEIKLNIDVKNPLGSKAFIIYGVFTVTVFLWLTDFWHGMNAYVVSFVPIVTFLSLGIITKEDLKLVSWDVLWLVSGGLALGLALERTGLATVVVSAIPFGSMPTFLIFLIAPLIGLFVASFMSNTATANLILPLVAIIGTTVPGLESMGGGKILILATTFCISLAMTLPISTPPNALAYSTGLINTRYMTKVGLILGVIGMLLVHLFLYIDQLIGIL